MRFAILLVTALLATAVEAKDPWRLTHSQGIMHFVLMDKAHWKDQDQYRLAIGAICAGKRICQVHFWKDAKLAPTKLPMSDAQVAAEVAIWQFNGNTGLRRLLWSCQIEKSADCLSGK